MDIHISKDKDKDYDSQAAEMRKTRDSSVESKANGPFVHNLPKRKPVMVLPITLKNRKCIIICIQMFRTILDMYLSFFLVALANFTCLVWRNTDIIAENWKMTRQSATDYNSCEAEGWDHWTKAKEDETRARTTNALGRTWEEEFENLHKVEIRIWSSKTLSQ